MRVVLDTNVVVSAALSPHGPSARLLDWVAEGVLLPVVSPGILAEYRDVLVRPKFVLEAAAVTQLLEPLEAMAAVVTPLPWPHRLADRDDEIFLATTFAGVATLVTGNLKHYPEKVRETVSVMTPRACLTAVEQLAGGSLKD